jgi:hypothetical protein
MRPTTACLAGLLGLLAGSAALAQIEQDPTTGRITCTTTAGHYTRRIITGIGEGGRVSGMVRLVRPDSVEHYPAAAGFIFKEAGARSAGVEIALRPGTADRIVIGVKMPGERALVELGEVSANLWIPLAISVTNGTMTVQIGQRGVTRGRVRMNGPLQPIMHCNSGIFEFRLGPGLGLGEVPVNVDPNAPPARAPAGGAPSPSEPSR